MLKEFKQFALKGNVMDMAVGVVIGAAFGKIVSSLVADIIMPVIGLFTAGVSISNLKYVISPAVMQDGAEVVAESAIYYGTFIQNIIDFIIIAFAIFLVVKQINKMKKPVEPKPTVAKVTSEELLTEIRDLLKKAN